jgi:hypothetical protein
MGKEDIMTPTMAAKLMLNLQISKEKEEKRGVWTQKRQ